MEERELTAADILAANDTTIEKVYVPEWGGEGAFTFVRSMTGTDREKYIESIRLVTGKGKKQEVKIILAESGAKLAQKTICNSKGVLLFSEAQIEELGTKSAKALQRCIDKAALINGLSDESEEEAKNGSPAKTGNE